jgi:hypothetical protein
VRSSRNNECQFLSLMMLMLMLILLPAFNSLKREILLSSSSPLRKRYERVPDDSTKGK